MVILCTASQAHLSWEQLQFLTELFFYFRNVAVKRKEKTKNQTLIKISTLSYKEKRHFHLCLRRCIFSQIAKQRRIWNIGQSYRSEAEIMQTLMVALLYPSSNHKRKPNFIFTTINSHTYTHLSTPPSFTPHSFMSKPPLKPLLALSLMPYLYNWFNLLHIIKYA